jgi:hypothetical protein
MDFENGLISDSALIGKPVNPVSTIEQDTSTPADWIQATNSNESAEIVEPESAPAPEPFKPLTHEERLELATSLHDQLLVRAANDLDGLMTDGSSQLNKILDLTKELVFSNNADAGLRVESDQAFEKLDPIDKERAFLTVLLECVPADRLNDALARLGMTLEEVERRRVCLDDLPALRARYDALGERIAEMVKTAKHSRM